MYAAPDGKSVELPYAKLCLRKSLLLHDKFFGVTTVMLCYNMHNCLNGQSNIVPVNFSAIVWHSQT